MGRTNRSDDHEQIDRWRGRGVSRSITDQVYEDTAHGFKARENTFVVAGGVAANRSLRKTLADVSFENNFNPIFPPIEFCGDNAAMIAWAGIQRFKKKLVDNVSLSAKSRWPLDKNAPYMKGPGLKL